MRTRCEFAVKYLLPAFRSMVASELITKYNLSQVEAAKRLGITQASISYYLHSKRGKRGLEELESNALLQEAAQEVAWNLANGKTSSEELSKNLCKICALIIDNWVDDSHASL